MTPAEVAALLTAAKALDDRVTVDRARAAAWSAVLDPDVEFDAARAALVEHYRVEVRPLMPADVNTRWRLVKRRRAEEAAERARLEGMPRDGVPMPPELRARFRRLTNSAAISGGNSGA